MRVIPALAIAAILLCVSMSNQASPAYLVDSGGLLLRFDTATPSSFSAVNVISGINPGESIVGLDFRPMNRQLYALTKTVSGVGRLYTIDINSAIATSVVFLAADPGGMDPYTSLVGTRFSVDFNPVVDRLRVVSDAEQNLRVNPVTGFVFTDVSLAYAAGEPNAGVNPNVVAIAYTNSFVGAAVTTLYTIDSGVDVLATQNPPNNGTLNTVNALGVDASNLAGFDIVGAPGPGTAYAALNVAGQAGLYTINLGSGAATLIGNFPGNPLVVDMSVFPDPLFTNGFE